MGRVPKEQVVNSASTDGKVSLVHWLGLVDDYWTYNGAACDNCEFNDHERGCDFLYATTVPQGKCPGVDVTQPTETA